jgi:hypothetical protein
MTEEEQRKKQNAIDMLLRYEVIVEFRLANRIIARGHKKPSLEIYDTYLSAAKER